MLLHQEVKQEVGQVSVIRRLLPSAAPPQQKPTDLGRVIQDTIGGDVKGSIVEVQQAVQQIQPQPQEVPSQQPMHVQQQVQLQVQEQVPQIQVVNHQGQEVQIQEQNDEEQVDRNILEKLKSLGISEQDVKIDITLPSTTSGSDAEDLVESLEDEDIQKYIGGEDGNANDKLFG